MIHHRGRTVTLDKGTRAADLVLEDLFDSTAGASSPSLPHPIAHQLHLHDASASSHALVVRDLERCRNCNRFTASQYMHSFTASLEQCKNRSWHTADSSWIVAPTTADLADDELQGATYCSQNCLYSFLISNELLCKQQVDSALHFFKRVDALRSSDGVRSQGLNNSVAASQRMADPGGTLHRPERGWGGGR